MNLFSLKRIFGISSPDDLLKMSKNLDAFVAELSKRKLWRDIDPSILRAIAQNAEGETEKFQLFAFISECFELVEKYFIPSLREPDQWIPPPTLFAITLSSLGYQLYKQSKTLDEGEVFFLRDQIYGVFTSAILCILIC